MKPLHERARLAADGLECKAWTAGVPGLLRECADQIERLQRAADQAGQRADRIAAALGDQAEALRLRNVEVDRLTQLLQEGAR